MKRTMKDRWIDFILKPLKLIVGVWMKYDAKSTYELHDGIKFNRKEPYVMLANHTFMFDVIHVPMRFKKAPFIVASQTLFNKFPLKFILRHLTHAIPKSKGASDIRTAKELIKAVRKNYPILIFPEGDTTFFGETNYIEESTYKLVKKLKVDVIVCTVRGGYLSKPRWATGSRKNRRIHMEYKIAISKDELATMSLKDIEARIKDVMYNNDYEYQTTHMIPHPGKKLAEGFENVTFICPDCDSINSLETQGNSITCNSCGTKGIYNEFGFIEGFKFNNLIDWDIYQRKFTQKLKDSVFETDADLYYANYQTGVDKRVGKVNIKYEKGIFHFTGALEEEVSLEGVINPIVTLRRNFNFTYKDRNFFMRLDKNVASFLRIAQVKY